MGDDMSIETLRARAQALGCQLLDHRGHFALLWRGCRITEGDPTIIEYFLDHIESFDEQQTIKAFEARMRRWDEEWQSQAAHAVPAHAAPDNSNKRETTPNGNN
jgi:hypothetical protein